MTRGCGCVSSFLVVMSLFPLQRRKSGQFLSRTEERGGEAWKTVLGKFVQSLPLRAAFVLLQ